MPVSRQAVYTLLQKCSQTKDLDGVRHAHSLILAHGLDSVGSLCDHLIRLFTSCGTLLEANLVFNTVPSPTVYTWHAIISAYSSFEEHHEAITMYHKMQYDGFEPDKCTYSCVLKACASIAALMQGRLVHIAAIRAGLDEEDLLVTTIIDMYSRCGSLGDASNVFSKSGCLSGAQKGFRRVNVRNIVSWNAMIAGHVQHKNGLRALELFEEMQQEAIPPDKATYVCILKAFSFLGMLEEEYLVHSRFIESGLMSDTVLTNTLVDVYSQFGRLDDAYKVFNSAPTRDAASWTVMLAGYAQHRNSHRVFELFERMKCEHIKVDQPLFLCMLKACTQNLSSIQGRIVHALVIVGGFDSNTVIANALVDMYAKCGCLNEAYAVFERLASRDTVSWSAMISAYCQQGNGCQALALFDIMQTQGFKADKVTLTCILKACAITENLSQGMHLHDKMVRIGVYKEVIVANALVDFYAKCASLDEARKVFDGMPHQDMVTWGSIISGYVKVDQYKHALEQFEKMQKVGIQADEITFSCILKGCTGLDLIWQGKLVHDLCIRSGYATDILIGNTLIDMYSKFGFLDEARKVFSGISRQDTVTWNAMIAGYVQNQQGFPAIELFDQMQQDNKPDNVTYTCTLKACGCVGAINHGRVIHDQVIRTGAIEELNVGTTLVDMYANCGSLDEACRTFEKLAARNVVTWNAMIAGYAQLGSLKLASECLQNMQKDGLKPDAWSYTSVLTVCSHEGLVEQGHYYFERMREDHGVMPSNEHLNCMIELLGSAGRLQEAEKLLQSMPNLPELTGWAALLGACKTFGDFGLGRVCFEQAHDLDSTRAVGYVVMSKLCADACKWKEMIHLQNWRKDVQAWKKPGQAWIEINNKVHEFFVQERAHPQSSAIYNKLSSLGKFMIKAGFVPQVDV